jgi:TatA/E family protein of Tat protein translocase
MLSIPHLVVLFTVALIVFGPHKLPELARNLGKIVAEFRRMTADMRGTFDQHMRELERETELLDLKKAEFARAQTAVNAGVPVPGAAEAAAAVGVVVEGEKPAVAELPTENSIGDFSHGRFADPMPALPGTVIGQRPTAAMETNPEPSPASETRELFPPDDTPQSGELFPQNNSIAPASPAAGDPFENLTQANEEDVHSS